MALDVSAVIFDMDGTLFDTERLTFYSWDAAEDEFGIEFPLKARYDLIGRQRDGVLKVMEDAFGDKADPVAVHDYAAMWTRMYMERYGVPEKGHPARVLETLRACGIKTGLATSTRRMHAEYNLKRAGIIGLFDATVCGGEAARGKPEPDIFLLAAEKLGVEPASCAVIEDSANGIRAGHAAGMHVVMVPDLIAPKEEITSLCETVLPSLDDGPGYILGGDVM